MFIKCWSVPVSCFVFYHKYHVSFGKAWLHRIIYSPGVNPVALL